MFLTAKARYAVMAMVELAHYGEGSVMRLADLGQKQDITLSYLEQIFAQLRQHGLVVSVRGPKGGYKLSRNSYLISILDIVTSVEEPIKMTRCTNQTEHGCMHDKSKCSTHHLWDGLGSAIENYLNNISLGSVITDNQKQVYA